MTSKIFLILIIALLMAFPAMAKYKTALFEFDAISMDIKTVEAATHIFSNELNATGKFTILPKDDVRERLNEHGIMDKSCYAVRCAAEYGAIVGANMSIIGTLTRLGNRITVEAQLVSVARREVVFSDRFSTTSVDELEHALRKLARAIASKRKIKSEVTRFGITEEETKEARRRKSYITTGASFGFGFPIGQSYADVDRLTTLAWSMRLDAGGFVVDNSVGICWGGGGEKQYSDENNNIVWLKDERSVLIIPWDIGLRYLFSRESDFSLFAGAGLGLHLVLGREADAQSGDDIHYVHGDQAMAMHLAGGLYAFQSYDFRLTVEAKYTFLLTDAFIGSDNSQQFGLSISISRKFEKKEKRGCMSGGCFF